MGGPPTVAPTVVGAIDPASLSRQRIPQLPQTCLVFGKGNYCLGLRDITPMMGKQMEKKTDNEMETGAI